jgi:hypothetical protein
MDMFSLLFACVLMLDVGVVAIQEFCLIQDQISRASLQLQASAISFLGFLNSRTGFSD